jgi:hypothetical protein
MKDTAPQAVRTLAIVNVVGGLVNATLGWFLATAILSAGGTLCSSMCTLGLCPLGGLFGMFGILAVPIGLAEAGLGLATLLSPESMRPFLRLLPYGQLLGVFVGDFISPALAIAGFALTRDQEVAAYLEGI